MTRIEYQYNKVIRPLMIDKFETSYNLERVILSMSSKKVIENSKDLLPIISILELISGEKAEITRVKKSLSGFGIKERMGIGGKVELKGEKMYLFLDVLINIILPRIRKKIINIRNSKTINIGVKDISFFPQIEEKVIKQITGLNITIITNSKNKEETLFLMRGIQIPII